MAADPIVDYVLTDHAIRELRRRGLDEEDIREVLKIRASVWMCGWVVWSYSPKLCNVELNTW